MTTADQLTATVENAGYGAVKSAIKAMINARIDNSRYLLGSPKFMALHGALLDKTLVNKLQVEGKTVIAIIKVTLDNNIPQVLGYLAIADRLRDTSCVCD